LRALLLGLASVVLSAAGQLLLAAGSRQSTSRSLGALLFTPRVASGLACWTASTLLWMAALRRESLASIYALTSLNYVLVPLGAHLLLGERVGAQRIFGMGLIVAGVLFSLAGPR
jgi:drug/metabolite transporter (DMT)-like permease